MYPLIDLEQTGIKLKSMINVAGYDVEYIQQYLHLSCPQSIYRWFKGKILPSVEHLSTLSLLPGVHMEELLVLKIKYTQLYSGATPVFVEDNIFEILIPMDNVAELQVGPGGTSKENEKTNKETDNKIFDILESKPEITVRKIAERKEISLYLTDSSAD